MASSKGEKSASNVMNLDDARKRRDRLQDASTGEEFSNDHEQVEAARPVTTEQAVTKSGPGASRTSAKTGNRSFDTEKVERIKSEIARGEYKIDYFDVADRYIEHERFS